MDRECSDTRAKDMCAQSDLCETDAYRNDNLSK